MLFLLQKYVGKSTTNAYLSLKYYISLKKALKIKKN